MEQASISPAPLPAPCANSLKILPLSDLHLRSHPAATEKILANRAYLKRPDYVLLLGDMVGLYGTPREYSALAQFVKRLETPYGAINGNHEFYFEVHEEDSPQYGRIWREASTPAKAAQLEKFKRFFGYEKLWRAEQNACGRFVFLGIDDIAQEKPETLSAPQLQFLAEQLAQSCNEPTYVFCHAPLHIGQRLDLHYYDTERTACVELEGALRELLKAHCAPLFWISGHIHLRPDHYMFAPYELAPNIWQIHCPDSWGYSRWRREHIVPQRHSGLFSRHLEIEATRLTLITHNNGTRQDMARESIDF